MAEPIAKAIPVKRGCGERTAGDCYAEFGVGAGGARVESFIVDPPVAVDIEALGITPIGVHLIERAGVWHVADWVGESHYPNVADFIEEARRFGVSRKIQKTIDFSKLTSESRMILLHPRAWIDNAAEYPPQTHKNCPKGKTAHGEQGVMCARLWWDDVEGGEAIEDDERARLVLRRMPSFEYYAQRRSEKVEPQYQTAIFASFPMTRLVVIRDEGETHERTAQLAARSSLIVDQEDR